MKFTSNEDVFQWSNEPINNEKLNKNEDIR